MPITGAFIFVSAWCGTAVLAWYPWLSSSSWWNGAAGETVVGTHTVRSADSRLFLEDALVVTAVVLLASVAVIVVARRRHRLPSRLLWALVGVGVLVWLVGPISAPREAGITCGNGSEDQSVADRGWSWTRFSEIVVLTDSTGTHEATCP
jgi:hypothetical protein